MAVVPTVVSHWVPQPFVLNTYGSVVERMLIDEVEYYGHLVTYTENPLPLGQVWQNTIVSATKASAEGLVSG